jgi:hypothetical protein
MGESGKVMSTNDEAFRSMLNCYHTKHTKLLEYYDYDTHRTGFPTDDRLVSYSEGARFEFRLQHRSS